jgi:hypothetical protein
MDAIGRRSSIPSRYSSEHNLVAHLHPQNGPKLVSL